MVPSAAVSSTEPFAPEASPDASAEPDAPDSEPITADDAADDVDESLLLSSLQAATPSVAIEAAAAMATTRRVVCFMMSLSVSQSTYLAGRRTRRTLDDGNENNVGKYRVCQKEF
ncbi:hypothetical protein GCM10022238_30310 [Gordonia hankookensis]